MLHERAVRKFLDTIAPNRKLLFVTKKFIQISKRGYGKIQYCAHSKKKHFSIFTSPHIDQYPFPYLDHLITYIGILSSTYSGHVWCNVKCSGRMQPRNRHQRVINTPHAELNGLSEAHK